jgi:hypothetical protein
MKCPYPSLSMMLLQLLLPVVVWDAVGWVDQLGCEISLRRPDPILKTFPPAYRASNYIDFKSTALHEANLPGFLGGIGGR